MSHVNCDVIFVVQIIIPQKSGIPFRSMLPPYNSKIALQTLNYIEEVSKHTRLKSVFILPQIKD